MREREKDRETCPHHKKRKISVNQIIFLGNRVDFSGGMVDFSGNRVDFSGGSVDFSGNRVDFSGGRVDFSGDRRSPIFKFFAC